jgi:hypothetical protein
MPLIIRLPNPGLTTREAKRLEEFIGSNGSKVEATTQQNGELIHKIQMEEAEQKEQKERLEEQLHLQLHNRYSENELRECYLGLEKVT